MGLVLCCSEERTTSRLEEELTKRPFLKLFIFKGHDCLVFRRLATARVIKIQYLNFGMVMHGTV
jgi:hypothetical protein